MGAEINQQPDEAEKGDRDPVFGFLERLEHLPPLILPALSPRAAATSCARACADQPFDDRRSCVGGDASDMPMAAARVAAIDCSAASMRSLAAPPSVSAPLRRPSPAARGSNWQYPGRGRGRRRAPSRRRYALRPTAPSAFAAARSSPTVCCVRQGSEPIRGNAIFDIST